MDGIKDEIHGGDSDLKNTEVLLDIRYISDFVRKLSRREMDEAIERISNKISEDDFHPKMSVASVIFEITILDEALEDPLDETVRIDTILSIVDSLDRITLDIFLEIIEIKIESGNFNHFSAESEVCDSCGECFDSMVNLVNHLEQSHVEEMLDCPQCGEMLPGSCLRKHIDSTHVPTSASADFIYDCDVCKKDFVSSLALKRHKKKEHTEESLKTDCTECSAAVTDMNTHMKSHEEKKFCCEHCSKRYRTKFDLKTHMNSVHLKVFSTCPHCGRQTANLNKHIYGNHTNEFPCNICGKRFARQTQLNYHIKAHDRGTIIEKAAPDIQKERKRLANKKYLEKRKARKVLDSELHEHEKNLKRIWARKNREKLMKYKKEYNEKKKCIKMKD